MHPDFLTTHTFQHTSSAPLLELRNAAQDTDASTYMGKPNGLWLDIDNAWEKSGIPQTLGEGHLPKNQNRYDVTLNPKSRILILDGTNHDEVIAFCMAYGRAAYPEKNKWHEELTREERIGLEKRIAVNWQKVSQDFDGFGLSAPVDRWELKKKLNKASSPSYQKAYTHILDTLHAFDVERVCIWNKDAIANATPIQLNEAGLRAHRATVHQPSSRPDGQTNPQRPSTKGASVAAPGLRR